MSLMERTISSLLGLALDFQKSFQLGRIIEMIFDGILAAAGNDDDVFDARGEALLDDILNQGLIDNGKHFLGLGFGGREKPRAQACGGEDGFAHASALLCHVAVRMQLL